MNLRPLSGAMIAAVVLAGHACGRGGPGVAVTTDSLIAEAKTFMEEYAGELRAGDVDALAARYDTTGAYLLGNGRKEFLTHDSIARLYRAAPPNTRPESFEWEDLSYEPIGPDAVVVVGKFSARSPQYNATLSYSALLRRQDGKLRIRVEDESIDPARVPGQPPSRDSVKAGKDP